MSSKFIFNEHRDLKGSHATFSASKSSWLRYTQEEMVDSVMAHMRAPLGTEIHEFAASQIVLNNKASGTTKSLVSNLRTYIYRKYYNEEFMDIPKQARNLINYCSELPPEVYETVKCYINDGIGFRMKPEQPLIYSDLFYGTADTISYNDGVLRIHDLKTGSGKVSMDQLLIYSAFFCLEYKIKPSEMDKVELRIYQNGEILCHNPQLDEIVPIMDKVICDNKYLQKLIEEG